MNDTRSLEEILTARTFDALAHLAAGYLDIKQESWRYRPVTVLPPNLQQGWNILTSVCFQLNISPPSHLDELSLWLHKPLEEWQGFQEIIAGTGLSGALLWQGAPRDLCYDLTNDSNSRIFQEELDQRKFRLVYEFCKEHNLDDLYRSVRLFIAEHPYLPDGQIEINRVAMSHGWTDEIRQWVVEMYEAVPYVSRADNRGKETVICCPRCGWTLNEQFTGGYACYSDVCSQVHDLRFLEDTWHKPCNSLSLRTKPGIQRFIVSPERELLLLYSTLQAMGLQCELWTGVDEFDLYVNLPGEAWAIDVKDYSVPQHLATNLNKSRFKQVRPWNRAYFVFPEHRRSKPYLNAVLRYWQNEDDRVKALFLNDFIEEVKRKLR